MTGKQLIPYPEERALEDAAYARGERPARLYPLLLPVWRVEIKATVTEAEPYDLIDYYLERGIADGALDTAAELAEFFSLDEALVDRALRVLSRIGHVRDDGGRVALTEIGHRSVRDKWRYTVKRQDRRELYFDGISSQPLTRAYYGSSTVTLLAGQDYVDAVKNRRGGPPFRPVVSQRMFRDEALAELAAHRDRDLFNLPERIDDPERVGPAAPVYLPAYLVRTSASDGRARLLAYTQAADTADEHLTRIYGGSPDLAALIENEESAAGTGRDEERARAWLRNRGLDALRPARQRDGMLRVTFPASAFGANGPLSLSKLGSFVVLGTDFFQVWCEDDKARRRALLHRIEPYAERPNVQRSDLEQRTARIGRQVGLGEVGLAELRRMASAAGKRDLVSLLDAITRRNPTP